ncbi:DUF4405 domain-containing protein [Janthinobacterium fluminis]|uniref:DUF4405 domain-containing protein n=1 Tax=Janthinobacterium fluminis TaxID=2987524 RepID=A0ABT5K0V9_9BURK|nr:DUF4405 domain-containing protein [Janthinobacterium fluminis]MDC8758612.1 DUF4405 domain-containing protein [Janthinobacterium fluminis]
MHSHKPATPHAHARHHINLRLERWHRHCLYASGAALLLSGAAWLLAHYFLRTPGEFGEAIHPLEPWAMKLHGASAMAALFFLGSLMNAHIRRALKAGRNLVSGWAMIATFALLIATGFGLYYLAGESDRPLWSGVHWVAGLALAALSVLHIVLGRRRH